MEESASIAAGKEGPGKLAHNLSTTPTSGETHIAQFDMQPERRRQDPSETAKESLTPHASPELSTEIEADTLNRQDRTRLLMAKYDLATESTMWPRRQLAPLERVSRAIRMRVRYTCHRCRTTFGAHRSATAVGTDDVVGVKDILQGGHPPEAGADAPPVAAADETVPETSDPAVTNHVCICHECQTIIEIEIEECPNCQHPVCDMCHKEARSQSIDEQDVEATRQHHEAERNAPPEEQKLPPDIESTKDDQPASTSR